MLVSAKAKIEEQRKEFDHIATPANLEEQAFGWSARSPAAPPPAWHQYSALLHIVSTCVKENGEKISDTYEWNRSMKACRELERKFGLKQVEDKRKELLEPYLKKADYQSGDVKKQVQEKVFEFMDFLLSIQA